MKKVFLSLFLLFNLSFADNCEIFAKMMEICKEESNSSCESKAIDLDRSLYQIGIPEEYIKQIVQTCVVVCNTKRFEKEKFLGKCRKFERGY